LCCRPIGAQDIANVADLLTKGFRIRHRSYWARALDRLMAHPTPSGLPKLGYLLEHDDRPVGVILLIFSRIPGPTGSVIRCNLSSWHVEPAFRTHASLLVSRTLRHTDVVYLNISPAPQTRAIIELQGFTRYCNGQLLVLPALGRGAPPVEVRPLAATIRPRNPSLAAEFDLLATHAAFGCVCVWCTSGDEAWPFAFLPRRIARGLVPVLQLIYCRDWKDFVRFAGPIGRHLARRGWLLVLTDAPGPLPGLPGLYFEGSGPKYFKGPAAPRLGDLAFTEGVLFGP
jgi:hypothetical protein